MPRRRKNVRGKSQGRRKGESSRFTRVAAPRIASFGGRIQNSINGFPDRYRTILVYDERIAITSTAGATALYRFSGNGLFDPNVTGTGAQPINFDTLSIPYLRYRCYGSSCEIRPISGTACDVALYPTNAIVTITIDEAAAQPYAKFVNGVILNGSRAPSLSSSMGSQKILGRDVRGSDAAQALVSAQPAEQWYWVIAVDSSDRATTFGSSYSVKIKYDVEFFDREAQGLSLADHKLSYPEIQEANRAARVKAGNNPSLLVHVVAEQPLPPGDSKIELPRKTPVPRECPTSDAKSWGDSSEYDMLDSDDYKQFLAWKNGRAAQIVAAPAGLLPRTVTGTQLGASRPASNAPIISTWCD